MSSVPPRVSRADVDATIAAITQRHRRVDAPHLDRITDDPADVLEYLRRHTGGLPAEVRATDLLDALVLRHWLWWQQHRVDLWILDRAEQLKLPRSAVRRGLGMRSNQGVRDATGRVRALFDPAIGKLDEKAWRRRRQDAAEHTAAVGLRQSEWLTGHAAILAGLVEQVVALVRDQADDDTYTALLALRDDARRGEWSAASLADLVDAADAAEQLQGEPARPVRDEARALHREYERLSRVEQVTA
jgi:hypothetical protein